MKRKGKQLKTMKKSKRPLTPKLRFPEFLDRGGWEEKKLGEVARSTTGESNREDSTSEGEYAFFDRSDDVRASGRFLFDAEAIIVAGEGQEFVPKYFVGKFDLHQRAYATLDFKKGVVGKYVFYWVYCNRKHFKRVAVGSTVASLRLPMFTNFPILIPSRPEQRKIAECLSSLDGLIAAGGQMLEALKAHKKGLMQQLFPQPDQTQPRLRFPEFRDEGEWEEKTLGQVAEYVNGKAHEQDIDEQGKYIVANSKFISTAGEVKKFSNAANLLAKKDDILMVLSDVPNGRAIAKCFCVDKDNTYTVNQRICKLTAKKAVSVVLFYILDRNAYFLAFDDGVKQTNLRKDDVLNCPLLLPKDKAEQQQIADCLSSLDTRIAAQAAKVDALKQHKCGLMQQLFPAPEKQ